MKKFAYFLFSLVFIANYSYSQGEVEALKYSRNELYGTCAAFGHRAQYRNEQIKQDSGIRRRIKGEKQCKI